MKFRGRSSTYSGVGYNNIVDPTGSIWSAVRVATLSDLITYLALVAAINSLANPALDLGANSVGGRGLIQQRD